MKSYVCDAEILEIPAPIPLKRGKNIVIVPLFKGDLGGASQQKYWRLEIAAILTKSAYADSIGPGSAGFVCVATDFQSVGDLQIRDAPDLGVSLTRNVRQNTFQTSSK